MHRLHCIAHERADDGTEGEDICGTELVDALVGLLWLDDCVEIPAIRHVYDERPEPRHVDPDACGWHVRGHVTDCNACDLVPAGRVVDPDSPRRYFDTEPAGRARANEAMLECKRNDTNRPVAAHGQAAAGFDEQDGSIVGRVDGREHKSTRHHVVAPRLEHQPEPNPVEAGEKVLAALTHARAIEKRRSTCHEPHRIAGRMSIDAEKNRSHVITLANP